MRINTNINAMNFYADKFNKNAENIAENKDLTKNLIEENINAKAFEVQTKPLKTEDEMFKSLLDIKA
jgi:flagellar hook protein FlgE